MSQAGTRTGDRRAAQSGLGPETTLRHAVATVGVGVHSGLAVRLQLRPAPAGTGILFNRVDLAHGLIPARFDRVAETRLGTTLRNEAGASIATIEHLMAALAGLGVDNAIIDVDGPEVPILDGSAAPFVALIETAGLAESGRARRAVKVLRRVRVAEDDKFVELSPAPGFSAVLEIAFDSRAIGRQRIEIDGGSRAILDRVAEARTFGFRHEFEALNAMGLARGGSLDNAIVVDGDHVLNAEGLRSADEFVRHKLLDALGDLYLAGGPILGRFTSVKGGHALNNKLLRALFSTPDAVAIVSEPAGASHPPVFGHGERAAAAPL